MWNLQAQSENDKKLDIKTFISDCGEYAKKEVLIYGEIKETIYRIGKSENE